MATEKRLIYLEDAIEKIVNFPSKVANDAFYGRKQFTPMQMLNVVAERQHEIIYLLEKVKKVDAVEVVRCKDCRRRYDHDECPMCNVIDGYHHEFTFDDGYCDRGERKNE